MFIQVCGYTMTKVYYLGGSLIMTVPRRLADHLVDKQVSITINGLTFISFIRNFGPYKLYFTIPKSIADEYKIYEDDVYSTLEIKEIKNENR